MPLSDYITAPGQFAFRPQPLTIGMPGNGIFGNGSGAPTSSSHSDQNSQSSTYSSNPDLMQMLAGSFGKTITDAASNYNNVVNNPTSSDVYKNSLSGMLAALVPSEQGARQNLADTFRAAGNTASSTFGQKASGLESDLMRNRQTMASDLLAKLYPAMTQAAYAPLSQTSNLIDALKLQQSSSTGHSESQSTGNAGGPNLGTQSFTGFQDSDPFGFFRGGGSTNTSAPGMRTTQPTNYPSSPWGL